MDLCPYAEQVGTHRHPHSSGAQPVPRRGVAAGQPQKQERDTFPTAYRLNSVADLARHFPPESFRHASYTMDSEPAYFGASNMLWRLVRGSYRITPERLGSMLFVFMQKR